jgi:tetratricopeptide (TPR) repeat protein
MHLIAKLMETSDVQRAVGLAREMKERYPGLPAASVALGVLYQYFPPNSKEMQAAEGELLSALRLDPMNGLAHARLGHLYTQRRQHREAIGHLEAANLILGPSVAALNDLCLSYEALGNRPRAAQLKRLCAQRQALLQELASLEKRLAADPENPALKRRHLDLWRTLGQSEAASELVLFTGGNALLERGANP